jgi:hypothetical protein
MSWIEKIDSEFIITTGDGKQYKPLWLNASKTKDYNVAEFDFPGVVGTLVYRGKAKGAKYNLEIYFQGDDHLDQSAAFEQSADDSRYWIISHPFYGNINVQPTSLIFDNSKYNVSKISGTILETITEDNPRITVDPVDQVKNGKAALDEVFGTAYDVTPDSSEIVVMAEATRRTYLEGLKIIKLDIDAEEYFNAFNTANGLITNATADPLAAITAINTMISYPAVLENSVKSRVNSFSEQLTILHGTIETIQDKADKKLFQNNGGMMIASQCLSAATPIPDDYKNRNQVIEMIDIIVDDYNQYIEDLDSLQTANGGELDSYIPDANALMALQQLLSFTIASLFVIALGAKQERTIYCEEDTNLILLAHRFHGLKADDSTLDDIIKNNNIGQNELLGIKKGRKVIFYV